jgi:hypothetical protein
MATNRDPLLDAAAVWAVREEIVAALGPLAASPLDEMACERMRRVLARANTPQIRAAVRTLRRPAGPQRPLLRLVGDDATPVLGGVA